ncbi:MAG TPA: branched-chain amino acid ABC transporter permease [Ramlibacter sp.]|nr:branched-chain amino acid ABC transporter permease [Ramlibacter sp.]
MISFLGVLFDGLAYGALLFLIGIGLSVTLGLMNFVHLAHGVFAMLGGYLTVTLTQALGMPFLAALPVTFLAVGLLGAVVERLLYRRFYAATALDQTLLCIGVVLMAIAAATFVFGPQQQAARIPDELKGNWVLAGVELSRYKVFSLGMVVVIYAGLIYLIERTTFGAQVRASVDQRMAAQGCGINVDAVFTACFALGTGLAGLGGAMATDLLGLDPSFPLKFMVYFLLVTVVGGAGSVQGPLVAALVLGVCDVAGKYYIPQVSAFSIYLVMVAALVMFPAGLGGQKK